MPQFFKENPSLLLFILLLFFACSSPVGETNELFQLIFYGVESIPERAADTLTFRGTLLGAPMEQALRNETKAKPIHQDKLGLSYELALNSACTMLIDYYSDHLKRKKPLNRISSIVANIILQDEVETARLYNQIQAYMDKRYGLSNGVYGNYSWSAYTVHTNNMEVRLVLNEDKKRITVNFIDLQPEDQSHLNELDFSLDSLIRIPDQLDGGSRP